MQSTPDDVKNLEDEVRRAVEEGYDIQERVRQITLRIIRGRSFDIHSLGQTARAVLRGARAGIQKDLDRSGEQSQTVRQHLEQAVNGLDIALAQFAEAAKLAVEEASGKAKHYSSEDLQRARSDLENLEKMFIESLQQSAAITRDTASNILSDLADHAKIHGSAVGRQMRVTVAVISHQLKAAGSAQADIGLHLARSTADFVRQIAAGMLTGLAEHIRPKRIEDSAPRE